MSTNEPAALFPWGTRRIAVGCALCAIILVFALVVYSCGMSSTLPGDRTAFFKERWVSVQVDYRVKEHVGNTITRRFELTNPQILDGMRASLAGLPRRWAPMGTSGGHTVTTESGSRWLMTIGLPGQSWIYERNRPETTFIAELSEDFIHRWREVCLANERKRFPGATSHHILIWDNLSDNSLPPLPPRDRPVRERALRILKEFDPGLDPDVSREAFWDLVRRCRAALAAEEAARPGKPLAFAEQVRILRSVPVDTQISTASAHSHNDPTVRRRWRAHWPTELLYHLICEELELPGTFAQTPKGTGLLWEAGGSTFFVDLDVPDGPALPLKEAMERQGLVEADLRPNLYLCRLGEDELTAVLAAHWSMQMEVRGKTQRSREIMSEAEKLAPGWVDAPLTRAFYAHLDGNGEECAAALTATQKLAVGPWALCSFATMKATELERRAQFDAALEVLEAAYRSAPAPKAPLVLIMMGRMHRHLRRWDKATECFRQALALEPDGDGYARLGSALTEAHRDEEAIGAFEKAMELKPEDYFPKVVLSGLYERNGNRDKGRALFATVQEPVDDKVRWHNALVWYYANTGDRSKMLDNMKAALGLNDWRTYRYYVREPDLDRYRKDEDFDKLMKAHAPRSAPESLPGEAPQTGEREP